ncbi:MAG TPA: PIG-L family deacetylase [Candidatus Acidoferrales bacterium]|nr:PIG-L family deacetylase [Candidatus Acidoferrales bacterium]
MTPPREALLAFLFSALGLVASAGATGPLRPLEPLLSAHTRLMVFSPHPDDETLAAGGLIQRVLGLRGAVKVVFMTSGDGFPEGVEKQNRIARPRAEDYRNYGKLRKKEARRALRVLGMKREDVIFLNFPDGGLRNLLGKHWLDRTPYFRSPFTLQDRPELDEGALLANIEFTGEDVKREVEKLLVDFRPNLIVVPDSRDRHADHCSTYFFVFASLNEFRKKHPTVDPEILTYLVHFRQWPVGSGAGTGSHLNPPEGFAAGGADWLSLSLSEAELANKRKSLLEYQTQMLVMSRYLMSFARANELFLANQEENDEAREQAKAKCLSLIR